MPEQATAATELDAVFLALADEKRREMMVRLSKGAMSVSELADPLGLRLPSAVKHLATLEASGLVTSQKTGRVRTYAMNPAAFDTVRQWIAQREISLSAAFDRLEAAISEFPEEPDE